MPTRSPLFFTASHDSNICLWVTLLYCPCVFSQEDPWNLWPRDGQGMEQKPGDGIAWAQGEGWGKVDIVTPLSGWFQSDIVKTELRALHCVELCSRAWPQLGHSLYTAPGGMLLAPSPHPPLSEGSCGLGSDCLSRWADVCLPCQGISVSASPKMDTLPSLGHVQWDMRAGPIGVCEHKPQSIEIALWRKSGPWRKLAGQSVGGRKDRLVETAVF